MLTVPFDTRHSPNMPATKVLFPDPVDPHTAMSDRDGKESEISFKTVTLSCCILSDEFNCIIFSPPFFRSVLLLVLASS